VQTVAVLKRGCKGRFWFVPAMILLIGASQCGKSFWEEGKEDVVRTLIDTRLEAGEYILFWDGRDEGKNMLPAGTYFARLRTLEFQNQVAMKGKEGGKGTADSSGYIRSSPVYFWIGPNFPDPFYMKSGTNIPFTVPLAAHVQLVIRNKE
jgi:hypothetical protein